MKATITGRNLEITDAIRGHVSRRCDKLTHFWDRVRDADVIAEKRGTHTFFVEFVVHADGHDPFVASVKHEDLYAAVDEAAAKLERQLRNHHARLVDHKH